METQIEIGGQTVLQRSDGVWVAYSTEYPEEGNYCEGTREEAVAAARTCEASIRAGGDRPPAVTDEMIDRMCAAYMGFGQDWWDGLKEESKVQARVFQRAALNAVLPDLAKLVAGKVAEAAIQSYHRGNSFDKSRQLTRAALLKALGLG
jgi:hypothetical protein